MATVKLDPAKGVQIPNKTTTERDAISSPETGALVWNTTTSAVNQYNGSAWKEMLRSDGSAASLTAIPAANITGTLPAISGANLTGIATPITALNNATANELVSVGSTTTELDAESGLTYDGTTLNVTGNVYTSGEFRVHHPSATSQLYLYGAAGQKAQIKLNEYGVRNWDIQSGVQASGQFSITASEGERLRIEHGGDVTIKSGNLYFGTASKGICLGAAPPAATSANTLDDYEEGTWTPVYTVVGGGSHSSVSAVNNGIYTKVGRMVTIGIESYVVSTTGTITYLKVTLPFTANSGGANFTSMGDEFGQTGSGMQLKIGSNSTYMTIKEYDGTPPPHNGYFALGITYQTA